MQVRVKRRKSLASRALLCILGMLLAAGCQTARVASTGGDVAEGQRIPVVRGPDTAGHWQSRDLYLDYRYRVDQNEMKLSVQVRFSDSVRMGFRQLRRFHLKLYWLEGAGNVLTTRGLYSVTQTEVDDGIHFTSRFPVPAGAAAMAFGYTGELRGQGLRGTVSPIWYVPTTAIGGAER